MEHFVGVDLDGEQLKERGADNLAAHGATFEDYCQLRRFPPPQLP